MEEHNIYRSLEINEIMGTLEKAQSSYNILIANQDAPGGRLVNVKYILEAVSESLSENGLGFFQFIELLDIKLRKLNSPKKEEIDLNAVINKTQYAELLFELDGFDSIAKDIMDVYDIRTLADLPACEYYKARSKILKIKRTQEEYLRKK
jgi:hypothetical protein